MSDILRCKMSTRDIPVHAIRTSISRLCLKEGGGGRQRGERGRGFVRRGNELLEGERMRARSPVYICADIESDIIHRVCARSYHTLLDQRALHTDVHADMHTHMQRELARTLLCWKLNTYRHAYSARVPREAGEVSPKQAR